MSRKKDYQNALKYKYNGWIDLMDQSLEEVENDPKQITNEMIVGIYEIVTEHLQPYDFEKVLMCLESSN